ncbi:EFHC2-like protein [Mya arenaria]|uniref:EF-hand domain-containing family member C2 n=1 Tax=Mya arenaria TaxID=6604 RepID=A0ABY7G2K5_MYAAR|nr:EFHC2-like protein [Mya arenaria]
MEPVWDPDGTRVRPRWNPCDTQVEPIMSLPFLPGNSFNPAVGKNKFHKSHHFDVSNDVSMLVGHEKPGIGGELLRGQKLKAKNSNYPRGEGSNLPAWVAFDRQVLCFDAFFQEAVYEKREEQYRVRNCKIYFYLEDDSIQVIEPRAKNSGVPQGTLIRRHRVSKPPPCDDEYYTVEDFNINKEINLYSKVFKITNCDEFTRNFLKKLGVRIQESTTGPNDPYSNYRKAMDESMQPLRPYEKHDTLKQFLDHDRHVLRFYCYWDDTEAMFGDPREMVLHYFLADDTIEIREVIPANSGRDAAPMFLRRGKLPKNVEALKQPGKVTDRTTGASPTEFYNDSDLTLGAVVNVWGRKYLLVDCDDFTKEYYKTKYGMEEFPTIQYKQNPMGGPSKEWPPYNGWGSEEDSLCSCMGLLPKPPRRDFIKFMEKDRRGLDSNVLRFLARMDTTKPIDMDRRFIISYFLSDDTILVFEPPVRNSGIIGGKFLERTRIKQPAQPLYSTSMSEYYLAQDLYVGAHFEKANVEAIVNRVRQSVGNKPDDVRSFFMRNDSGGTGIIQSSDDGVDARKLVAIAQEQLRKRNYEGFAKLIESFQQADKEKSGCLDAEVIRNVFQAHHVPLPDDICRAIMCLAVVENGKVMYQGLVDQLNWRDCPVAPMQYQPITSDESWSGNKPGTVVSRIQYQPLLDDIFGKQTNN